MRLIDIAIPKLGDDPAPTVAKHPKRPEPGFQLPSNMFANTTKEYVVKEDGGEDEADGDDGDDEFFEATEGGAPVSLVCLFFVACF